MANLSHALDHAFAGLADPTRRAVISRLTKGPAAVSELAKPFHMGLPTFLKHLRALERGGLISSEKHGRVRTCRLNAAALKATETWLSRQRAVWEGRAERLAAFVENEQEQSS